MPRGLYGLEIRYNDNQPLYCFSAKPAGVGAQLYTEITGFLDLTIYIKIDETRAEYQLKRILPSDKLRFRYLNGVGTESSNITRLEDLSRAAEPSTLQPGFRLGLDVQLESGKTIWVSHPDGGAFRFILGNVPLDHARAQFMAGNHMEEWHWQFPDLYPNEAITLEVVGTNWNDPPPSVGQRDKES
jgi:hypothetical protein